MKGGAVQRNNPSPPAGLPRPPASPLAELIRARIAADGPIPFRDFMELALYHPAHGYYRSGRAAIGRQGDYFTNVSTGPLFGALLARQFAEMWTQLGHPRDFTIVEQGAHAGDLAADVLDAMRRLLPDFADAARYFILEPSPRLRSRQRARLEAFREKVTWRRSLAEVKAFRGVHFSNELLDAFPVDAVVWNGSAWRERRVDYQANHFVFHEQPIADGSLLRALAAYPAPPGIHCLFEINTAAADWIASAGKYLAQGYLLTIDYGGAERDLLFPARTRGTLRGYAQHRRLDDVLLDPGNIDITADVDFTALARAAEKKAGFRLHGFADQHHFMVGLGLLHFQDSDDVSPAATRDLRNFQTLMHPEMMGTSFHAICFAKGIAEPAAPLAGFKFSADPRRALDLD
jgi:SAM-dependent MidA family methyltransferase